MAWGTLSEAHTTISHKRHAGAFRVGQDTVRFRVWAPAVKQAALQLIDGSKVSRTIELSRRDDDTPENAGYFSVDLPGIPSGQRYRYRLNDRLERPDPCSLWQPDDIAGPSAVYFPEDFAWTDAAWRGVPRGELVIYELHIGTFTPAGTFDAAIERLDDLVDLGVTAIEVMPIAQFPGDRNWGYDGALIYAAQHSYGGPEAFQRLVDAAHARGLALILDVVYNHLGPEHSYARDFGPYFTDKYRTPWGDAINYDDRGSDAVRRWVLDNARMWLSEFHCDGLRIDAVHAIYDLGATHILSEIHEVAREVAEARGWPAHIIAESDLSDPRLLKDLDHGGYGLDAQWSDDFHHSVHALLTHERRGYYVDYGEAKHVADVLASPFLGAGEYSRHRGRRHGAPPIGLGGDRFVICIQNHDQVGNRAVGDRLSEIVGRTEHGAAKQRLAASLMLLAPHLPMLFMGEEYAEPRRFPFFCSFEGDELQEAVRKGRTREFADFVDSPDEIPDPAAKDTFDSAKLTWSWPDGSAHAQIRSLYRELLHARRVWPAMRDFTDRRAQLLDGSQVVELIRGGTLHAWLNLGADVQPISPDLATRLLFSSEAARYGGMRGEMDRRLTQLLPYECVVFGPAEWLRAADTVSRGAS